MHGRYLWTRRICNIFQGSSKFAPLIHALLYGGVGRIQKSWTNRATHPLQQVLTYSTARCSERHFFQYLSITFNAQLLHIMAFNSYAVIEAKMSAACDTIHDGWYTNFVQAASVYDTVVGKRREDLTIPEKKILLSLTWVVADHLILFSVPSLL